MKHFKFFLPFVILFSCTSPTQQAKEDLDEKLNESIKKMDSVVNASQELIEKREKERRLEESENSKNNYDSLNVVIQSYPIDSNKTK